jgi:sulfotransferase family protein
MPLPFWSRSTSRRDFDGSTLPQAIRLLESHAAGQADGQSSADAPIFLLSAGWRSGSTLVQRLINSDSSVLLWGEPFEDFALVHRLARTVELFWPEGAHLKHSIDHFEGSLSEEWIANLNPGLVPLRYAHREFFERLFAAPARERGRSRWGCKWVRLTAGHAYYLRWMYPAARFVFLVRHPLHSLSSYQGRRWFYVRPNMRVTHGWQFLDHWRRIASSFLAEHRALGAMLVRYEDLVSSDEAVRSLSEYLNVQIDREVLRNRVGASGGAKESVGRFRRLLVARQVGDLCEDFGYEMSGAVASTPRGLWSAP